MAQLLLQCFCSSQLRCGKLLRLAELGLERLKSSCRLFDLPPSILKLDCHRFALLPRAVYLAVRTILHPTQIAVLVGTALFMFSAQRLQFLLKCLVLLLGIVPFEQQRVTLLLQLLNLRLALYQQQIQIRQTQFGRLTPGHGL